MSSAMDLAQALRIRGQVQIPGDKSISHRALVLAAMATGRSRIEGRAPGADQNSMIQALRALGAKIEDDAGVTRVHGVGLRGMKTPSSDIDCGNSGATMRFLMGAIAGIDGTEARLVGDASLSRRPMARVAEPLRQMGAGVDTAAAGHPPVSVRGASLHGEEIRLEVPSAQVKTAVILAALNADGETKVVALPSRDHTERMLRRLGVDIDDSDVIRVRPPQSLPGFEMTVPGDPSSAAFWAVLAAIHPDAQVIIGSVCLNPFRTGFLGVLGRMGASPDISDSRDVAGEAVADVAVRSATMHGTEVSADEVPTLIDEVPVLAVAATQAQGETWFRGVGELRVKEVDRLAAVTQQLGAMGADLEVVGDDLRVAGGTHLRGAHLDAGGDHRTAMALAVAATIAEGPSTLEGANAAAVSYPDFFEVLRRLVA